MNKRPELDLNNPPGQIVNRPKLSDDQQLYIDSGGMFGTMDPPTFRPPRYLRDIIKAAYERSSEGDAPAPLPDAEKRLERLVEALLNHCDKAEATAEMCGTDDVISTSLIRALVKNKA